MSITKKICEFQIHQFFDLIDLELNLKFTHCEVGIQSTKECQLQTVLVYSAPSFIAGDTF